ncbi:MAG: RNA polymerase sigma factor [Deltaproteobacteria bacterium]|nr:RNA polymerase sigma factor [Deltaproteobacteria bacterium]
MGQAATMDPGFSRARASGTFRSLMGQSPLISDLAASRDPLEVAYQRFFPVIREKCRRMLSDFEESQDVAQETFIRLWQSGLTSRDPRTTTAWIFKTSTRLAIDRLRHKRRTSPPSKDANREEDDDGWDSDGTDSAGTNLESAIAARQELETIARELPERELEMAILSRVDGLVQTEIAEVLEVSERTVRRVLTRFDARLVELRSAREAGHG